MKLRSGKTLIPINFKHKREQRLGKQYDKMIVKTTVTELDSQQMKEVKTFFSSLFYHCCKNIGYKEWVDEMERTRGRKVTVDELLNWEADETFWKEHFQKTWFRMQNELPCITLLQAFEYFVMYEYNLEPESPKSGALKPLVRNQLLDLYYPISSAKIVQLMEEQSRIEENFTKQNYLQELASDVASQIVNPLFNKVPCQLTWDRFFKSSKSSCCFVPIEGGRTIIRSSLTSCNFSMFSVPDYYFKVVETRETFKSPERDPYKAFLLHRKIQVPCGLQEKMEH